MIWAIGFWHPWCVSVCVFLEPKTHVYPGMTVYGNSKTPIHSRFILKVTFGSNSPGKLSLKCYNCHIYLSIYLNHRPDPHIRIPEGFLDHIHLSEINVINCIDLHWWGLWICVTLVKTVSIYPSYLPHANHWASQVVLVVENLSANAGDIRDLGLIPGLGRSPGEWHGNLL